MGDIRIIGMNVNWAFVGFFIQRNFKIGFYIVVVRLYHYKVGIFEFRAYGSSMYM